jgi:ribosomal protein L37E
MSLILGEVACKRCGKKVKKDGGNRKYCNKCGVIIAREKRKQKREEKKLNNNN